jgi:putative DNA primase/helicase
MSDAPNEDPEVLARFLATLPRAAQPPAAVEPKPDVGAYRAANLDLIPLRKWNDTDREGKPVGKAPRDPLWRKRVYTHEQIDQAVANGQNVGYRMGPLEVVIDYDPRNDPDGSGLVALRAALVPLTEDDFSRVKTPSGGMHLYGRTETQESLRANVKDMPGVELKGLGRQVVAVGSRHPNGGYYEWDFGPLLTDAPTLPSDCALLVAARKPAPTSSSGAPGELSPEQLAVLLAKLDPRNFQDHDDWLAVGMASFHATGGQGVDEFVEWSTSDEDYADHGPSIRERWLTWQARAGEPAVTARTLFHLLDDAGQDLSGIYDDYPDDLPPENEIPDDERERELARIAGELRRQAMSEVEIRDRVAAVNAERCREPLPDEDVRRIAQIAARQDPVGHPDTDTANARRFVEMFGDRFRHCEKLSDKTWFENDGKRWVKGLRAGVRRAASEVVRQIAIEAASMPAGPQRTRMVNWAKKSESRERLSAMIEIASKDLEIDPDQLDADWSLLNVQNGTLVLEPDGSVELREHRREDYITKVAAAPFHPSARCGYWDDTLKRALPDAQLRAYLQRCFGYTLLGGQGEKAIFSIFGTSDCMKTTILHAFEEALGDYAVTTKLETFGIRTDSSPNTPGLAMLPGARLVVVNEIPPSKELSIGLLKSWSGGDTIPACQKNEHPFTFMPAGQLWFVGEERIQIPRDDAGAWRRTHLIPFEQKIPKEDQDLRFADRINQAAVLAWAVEGYRMYCRAGGLNPPEIARAAVEEYRDAMDPIRDFIEERLDLDPGAWTQMADLYNAYVAWCRGRGDYRPISMMRFSPLLTTGRPGISKEMSVGSSRTRGARGVRIRGAHEYGDQGL